VFFLTLGGLYRFNDERRNSIQAAITVCQQSMLFLFLLFLYIQHLELGWLSYEHRDSPCVWSYCSMVIHQGLPCVYSFSWDILICVWGSQTWRTCFDFVVCLVVPGQLQGIVTEVNAVLHEPSLISLVKEAHLWLVTFGELKWVLLCCRICGKDILTSSMVGTL
jgi:hypothetical protein